MPKQELLNELLLRWEESRGQGNELSAQELCHDCPDLVPELEDKIRKLASMEGWLDLSAQCDLTALFTERDGNSTDIETVDHASGRPSFEPRPAEEIHIPGYDILDILGRGGMGVVYKAREHKLNRIVALKMILSGSHACEKELNRFQTEAQAIAQIQHANIVQIFEVGEQDGNPFLSLEYCGGGSLHDELDGTPLTARAAAETVEVLARAIHTAHQRQVIHRDLKPANVLKTENGQYKITDFGLAKKLDQDSGQTKSGAIVGTPSYMAPEQAAGEIRELGPAVDIYALGAILYECLTGRPPFKAAIPVDTVMQVINDEPVPPRRLQSNVPKDLETICLKCLRKDAKKRYVTALELAEDIKRFLNEEPILARPISRSERLWRWCRKNPRVAGLSALLVAVVACSLVVLTWLYLVAEEQRGQAELQRQKAIDQKVLAEKQKQLADDAKKTAQQEAEKARQTADILVGMFEASDPMGLKSYTFALQSGSVKMTAKELLERGKELVEKKLKDQPLVQAATMDTIGGVYRSLGRYDEAEELIQRAYRLRTKHLGVKHIDIAASLHHLGWLHHNRGMFLEAEDHYQKALAMRRKLLGDEHPAVTDTLFHLAWMHGWMGNLDTSEQLFRDVLERRLKEHGTPKHREVAIIKASLASVYLDKGDIAKATPLAIEASNTFLELEGNKTMSRVASDFIQAVIAGYGPFHSYKTAEKMLRNCVEIAEGELGTNHPYVAVLYYHLADMIEHQGKRDAEAEEIYERALAIVRTTTGLGHPKATLLVQNIASLYTEQKKFSDANVLFQELLEAQERQFGKTHFIIANSLLSYSRVLRDQRNYVKEEKVLRRAANIYRQSEKVYSLTDKALTTTFRLLANNYRRTGQYEKALNALQKRRGVVAGKPNLIYHTGGEMARLLPRIAANAKYPQKKRIDLIARCQQEALGTLEQAIAGGYTDTVIYHEDSRLAELSRQPAFGELLKKLPPVDWNKTKIIRDKLTRKDARDTDRKKSYCKVQNIELKANVTYQIDLKSADFDTYLRLEDSNGKQLAFNDDVNFRANNLDSRLRFTPKTDGQYRIIVTSFYNYSTGMYSLIIREQ